MSGNDRSLAVVVTANLQQMKAELAKADAVIATTTSAMKRMGESYSGASTISNANAAMLAVKDLGGVSKLTESEQRKLNSTVTEAIAKYQALGQQAPADMLKLRDATNRADDSTETLTGRMRSLAGVMGVAFGGAAVVQGIKSLIGSTLEYAETIKDTAAKMDVSMEAAQRWKFAAEQTGASLDNVSAAVLNLSKGIDGDDKSLRAALEQAGVQFDSLKGMKPEDAFNTVAAAIAKIPDPMTQARVTLEAFGKSGTELLPALRQGFVDLGNEAAIMSDKTINALDNAKDAWDRLSQKVTTATGGIIGKILGMVEKVAPAMQLMLTLGGQQDAAEAWAAFASGADQAANSVEKLSAAEKKYVDELIKAGKWIPGMSPAIDAYVASLQKAPPIVERHTAALVNNAAATKASGISWSGTIKDIDAFNQALYDSSTVLMRTLPGVTGSVTDFLDSVRVGNDPIISWSGVQSDLDTLKQYMTTAGTESGTGFAAALSQSLSGLGDIIIGAIQGGGKVGSAAFAYIGNSLGSSLGKSIAEGIGGTLGKTLGGFMGPIGSMLGGMLGGVFDKIFGKNQGREDATGFAAAFGGFDALREKMLVLGDEGERLWIALTQNTKGPAQVAATIRQIEDAFRRQEEAAKTAAAATEVACKREEDATNKVKAAIQSKIDVLSSERDSVFGSIREELENPEYDEAGNRIYGVIEAQGLARMREIDLQKAALQIQMEEASAKVTDQAVIVRKGIEAIFNDPIKVILDYVTNLPGGGFPGGTKPLPVPIAGGSGSRPSFAPASATTVIINNPTVRSDSDLREITRQIVRYLPGQLALAGR